MIVPSIDTTIWRRLSKGTKYNPIRISEEFRDVVMNTDIHDCTLYFINDENIKAYLDVFSEMKRRNIEVEIVKE